MIRNRLSGRLEPVLFVAIGGFAGANARYVVDSIVSGGLLPTFLVNVLGSFALGLLVYDALANGGLDSRLRRLLGTGFLSSFTTYSAFALDVVSTPESALVYVGGSYVCGFGAVFVARAVRSTTVAAADSKMGGS